jgi:hypothetical protein
VRVDNYELFYKGEYVGWVTHTSTGWMTRLGKTALFPEEPVAAELGFFDNRDDAVDAVRNAYLRKISSSKLGAF